MSTAADVLAARIAPLAIIASMSPSGNHSMRTVSKPRSPRRLAREVR
jgi:hypothetical protein